uniref:Uncharacterized protein n=1 Tax=Rhizophora mucronata TaxID=61149 RepID=A0A2P2PRC7_RHIMU
MILDNKSLLPTTLQIFWVKCQVYVRFGAPKLYEVSICNI